MRKNKFIMDKKKIIFLTDMALIPVFALTAYTGIELHVAGHGTDHQVWHDMAVFHSIAGFSFLILAAIHVKYHWAWYKALKSKGLKNKSKIVAALSALFTIVAASGILLAFFIDGANTHVGLWHYKAGLVTGVLASLHIFKRWALLRKGTAPILRP